MAGLMGRRERRCKQLLDGLTEERERERERERIMEIQRRSSR